MQLLRVILNIAIGICIGIVLQPLSSGDWRAMCEATALVALPIAVCVVVLIVTRNK